MTKNKMMLASAMITLLGTPVLAAEGQMSKGSKSYQTGRSDNAAASNQAMAKNSENMPQSAEEMATMEPAAGGHEDMNTPNQTQAKSMREEMRLPRKN